MWTMTTFTAGTIEVQTCRSEKELETRYNYACLTYEIWKWHKAEQSR